MKIEWIEGERYVPKLGLMISGMIKDVEKELGEEYVRQGRAQRVHPKKTETQKDKPPETGGEEQ